MDPTEDPKPFLFFLSKKDEIIPMDSKKKTCSLVNQLRNAFVEYLISVLHLLCENDLFS